MILDESDDLLQRYIRDGDAAAFEALAVASTPLIRSICRRHLHDIHDVDDACQETLVKLARSAAAIDGSLAGWLAAAARSSCIDLIRRNARARRHARQAHQLAQPTERLTWETARQRLDEALAIVDPATREVVIRRFLRGAKLQALADDHGTSVATASRRIKHAMAELRAAYEDLGFDAVDDIPLDGLLDPWNTPGGHTADGLRFAADWRAMADDFGQSVAASGELLAPGWRRPIRIGVFVGRMTSLIVTDMGFTMPIEGQLQHVGLDQAPGYEFIGVIESGTEMYGDVERTLRTFDIHGGLIDATDAEALATLDVLMVGNNFGIAEPVLAAFHRAVRGGVGFYSQGWLGLGNQRLHNPDLRALLLSEGPAWAYHHPMGCGTESPMTIRRRHPILAGLAPGDSVNMSACALWTRPSPGAQVLATSELASSPHLDLPRPMPVIRCGSLGRGRVLICPPVSIFPLRHRFGPGESYLGTVFHWLAEPRRVGAAATTD